jgi:predicted NUDIX family NTP pyrophosphohydrolase
MNSKISAGLVAYRSRNGVVEVFIAHPGGPLFAHKDLGHWSIPKGEIEPGEALLAAAIREFGEEIAGLTHTK